MLTFPYYSLNLAGRRTVLPQRVIFTGSLIGAERLLTLHSVRRSDAMLPDNSAAACVSPDADDAPDEWLFSADSDLSTMADSDEKRTCLDVRRRLVPSSNLTSYDRCGKIRVISGLRHYASRRR